MDIKHSNPHKKFCAFSGRRRHKFSWKDKEDDPRCIALKKVLTEQIIALVEAGVTDFFSRMAEGTDQYCSQIVLRLREKNPVLKLHCVLPHEEQADKWSDSARVRHHGILKQADSVDYVSRAYYEGCMLDCNRRLVEQTGILLAVYNRAPRSGTRATLNSARKVGREIIVIDPITQHVTHEGPALDLKL